MDVGEVNVVIGQFKKLEEEHVSCIEVTNPAAVYVATYVGTQPLSSVINATATECHGSQSIFSQSNNSKSILMFLSPD